VDYVPWPEIGCSLAEARKRAADRELLKRLEMAASTSEQAVVVALEENIGDGCVAHLSVGRIVAYGRAGSPTAEHQLIKAVQWRSLDCIGWQHSTAELDGTPFFDVVVYPALLAPCRVDLLVGRPLIEVFKQLVLGDSEVAALGKQAVHLAPEFAPVFVQGARSEHGFTDWPLAFERWAATSPVHPDPAKRSKFELASDADPIEVIIADEALNHRYRILVSLLREGDLEAQGLPATPGHPLAIPRSIWSHEGFHFDARTGDILQDNPEPTGRHDDFIKRWIGVVLLKPQSNLRSFSAMFHGKPATHDGLPSTTSETQETPIGRSKAIARVETIATSLNACVAWLKEIISASPKARTYSNDELWAEAKQKWPGTLSRRKLHQARAEAISSTPGASAWVLGGRRKKPQHSNRRTD
jgi:hypothetical protein